MISRMMWLAAASAFALAACGRSGTTNDQVPANEIAPAGAAGAQATANPFADAERRMSQAMMAAMGADAGDSWARKMIAHHQGAIDMSEAVLQLNPKPDVAQMARMGIRKQQMDIAAIEKLQKQGPPDPKSADLYKPAMMDMQQKMEAAVGTDVSETFMRKMLEHHKGAVAMSDVAVHNGVSGALRQQVEKTRSENQKEAEMVQAMLEGKSMRHAMNESGSMAGMEGKQPSKSAGKKPSGNASSMGDMSNMDMNRM